MFNLERLQKQSCLNVTYKEIYMYLDDLLIAFINYLNGMKPTNNIN